LISMFSREKRMVDDAPRGATSERATHRTPDGGTATPRRFWQRRLEDAARIARRSGAQLVVQGDTIIINFTMGDIAQSVMGRPPAPPAPPATGTPTSGEARAKTRPRPPSYYARRIRNSAQFHEGHGTGHRPSPQQERAATKSASHAAELGQEREQEQRPAEAAAAAVVAPEAEAAAAEAAAQQLQGAQAGETEAAAAVRQQQRQQGEVVEDEVVEEVAMEDGQQQRAEQCVEQRRGVLDPDTRKKRAVAMEAEAEPAAADAAAAAAVATAAAATAAATAAAARAEVERARAEEARATTMAEAALIRAGAASGAWVKVVTGGKAAGGKGGPRGLDKPTGIRRLSTRAAGGR
jgi:DNA polymerase III gamma/tau subunit